MGIIGTGNKECPWDSKKISFFSNFWGWSMRFRYASYIGRALYYVFYLHCNYHLRKPILINISLSFSLIFSSRTPLWSAFNYTMLHYDSIKAAKLNKSAASCVTTLLLVVYRVYHIELLVHIVMCVRSAKHKNICKFV